MQLTGFAGIGAMAYRSNRNSIMGLNEAIAKLALKLPAPILSV
jgi:hypothetical protein